MVHRGTFCPTATSAVAGTLITMNTSQAESQTEVLRVHECWKYLRSTSVGRLAVVKNGEPEIFPVNYLPEDGTVLFQTGPGTKLDAVLGGVPVVMEADGFNTYGTISWSVVVKGHPEPVSSREEILAAVGQGLSPWEPGEKDYLVRITPTEISGRRFVIQPSTRWWAPQDKISRNE